ncbi:hypothetical protein E0Z10_g8335 [Xylaria hypoxylon]|uniref:Rhodopsin domain-containing protein n=1 Tax=Xylaria hypoxylon TaxID=37992 RepID=A0A4Z0YK05_9PEZI|nr:hypothetical protein E0Z10_g8335 [Xylaria hypoxylon]
MTNPYYQPSYNPYPSSVLIGSGILFIIVPVAAVSLHFYALLSTVAGLGIDDWLTLPAVVLCVWIAIIQIIAATAGGLGGHQQLDEHGEPGHTPQLYIYKKTRYAYEVIGAAGLYLIKLSVLFFFRRIFRVPVFILVNNIVIGLTASGHRLESEYAENNCAIALPFRLSFAFTDLILDVIIFILPVPHLYRLVLPTMEKLGVSSIFFLGCPVVAIGITRAIIYNWGTTTRRAASLEMMLVTML